MKKKKKREIPTYKYEHLCFTLQRHFIIPQQFLQLIVANQ